MAGLSNTLEIARSTLLNQQVQIQTTSHNIANAENKAYARQKANVVTNPAERIQAGWAGSGAHIDKITQIRDQYVEQQLMASSARESDFRTRSSFLELIGSYLNDDGNVGVTHDLGDFWDAWDALSQKPGGIVERQGVVSAAEALAGTLQSTSGSLISLQGKIQSQTRDTVSKINTLLSEIADYNKNIAGLEISGKPANDLRDLRYQALTDLSLLAGVSYVEEENGAVTITLQDGSTPVTLVSDHNAGTLSYDEQTGLVSYRDANQNTPPITANDLSGGVLAGLLSSLQSTTEYSARLNVFTGELIEQVNSSYGQNVFDGIGATDVTVNSTFKNTSNMDADRALVIAELQNTDWSDLGNSRFIDYLGAMQHQIGLDQQDASSRADFQQALALHLGTIQQSVSGVSIDEEMIDLLKYQQVYQAAAKIISSTREMLNAVIEMVG